MKNTLILIFLLLLFINVNSQNLINNRVKTQYILSFLRYLKWENEDSLKVYKIGVYANDSVMFNLITSKSKGIKIKRKKIKVILIKNIKDIQNIQIIYSDKTKSNEAIKIYKQVEGKGILMVTDRLKNKNETMMNFMPIFYVRVEINEETLAKEGFFLPSIFKILARIHKKNYEEMYDMVNDSLENERKIIEKQKLILNNQKKEINTKETLINSLNTTLKNKLALIKQKENNLKEYSIQITQKDSILTNNLQILNSLKQDIKKQYKQITISKNKLQIQENEIKNKKNILNSLNQEINNHKIKIKQQKGELKETHKEIEFQQYLISFIGVALILFFLLILFIYRNYRNKKKANKILEDKNEKITRQKSIIQEQNEELNQLVEEVTSQKDEIESQRDLVQAQKNKIETIYNEVSQSIDYAQRIQLSVFPKLLTKSVHLSDLFIMFKPKDKVSGDFYWWKKMKYRTIITAADCTGHGVPGAFMSMLGNTFLNEITSYNENIKTGEILNLLRTKIIETLKQKGKTGEQKDGMDMAIISIEDKSKILQYSGANNPLYIISDYKLNILSNENKSSVKLLDNTKLNISSSKLFYEIKPNKMPIAIYEKMEKFYTHFIQLHEGDCIYMFSDGFADQFGGPNNKKFKYKAFKKILLENSEKPMKEQKNILEKVYSNWKSDYEQIDDVLVVGIKI